MRHGTVVVFSGGMDSTTLLYLELARAEADADRSPVRAISIDYGQRHNKELEYAFLTCQRLYVEHQIADISALRSILGGSALTDDIEVPYGHYADESMKATVVPNRNMLLLAVATAYAVSTGSRYVVYGAHAGDHTIYPDCRPEFAEAMEEAMLLCDFESVILRRPFIDIDKTAVARWGEQLGVRWIDTWSCYEGKEIHCGRCGTCVERKEAFREAGIDDPTEYANV